MNEANDSELKLLRQAIARLSDRMEHMEQKLRAIERIKAPQADAAQRMDGPIKAAESLLPNAGVPLEVQPKVQQASATDKNIPPVIPEPPVIPPAPIVEPAMAVPGPVPPEPETASMETFENASYAGAVPPEPQSAAFAEEAPLEEPTVAQPQDVDSAFPGQEPPMPKAPQGRKPNRNIELNIGKYWLNKIGIGIFVLGVGFLVAYSSRYFGHFGPWGKILTGYLVSAALFFTGWRLLRKEGMVNYGHVLTGGAWALCYFTTFAMHHFPQSRVLQSEGADMVLLAAVAAGMLIHSLRFRSEALSGVAIFVGYATATIGDVRFFTLISCAIESVVILVLVHRFKWLRMLFMGILMTYGAHFLWVMKNMHGPASADPLMTAKSLFLLNATFLTLYWAVFTAGVHLLRKPEDESFEGRLSVANIGNALLYFLLTYPEVTRLFPDQRFNFVVALGTTFLMLGAYTFSSGKGKLFVCDTMLGIALITAAIPIKYMPLESALIWIAELPLLYYAGLQLKSGSIRVAAFLLFAWIILHHAFSLVGNSASVELMGIGSIPLRAFTAFASALSFAGVFTLLKRASARGEIGDTEKMAGQLLPAAASFFLSVGTVLASAPQNLTAYLFFDALLLFGWGYLSNEPAVRIYSLIFLVSGVIRFQGVDNYMRLTAVRRWVYIAWEIVCGYAIYFLYRSMRLRQLLGELESLFVTGVAVLSGALVLSAVFRYVPGNWVTFTLAGLAAVTFAIAYVTGSRSLRSSALAGSAMAAARFVFVDSFSCASFADWAVISFPALSQAGIYYLYRELRADGKLPEDEKNFPDAEYVLFQITAMALVLRYVPDNMMTPAFAALNLALFGIGCLLREKFVRLASVILMPVVMARFTVLDSYPRGARIFPLGVVLGSYYLLAYAYRRALSGGVLEKNESPSVHMAYGVAAFLTTVAVWRYVPDNWAAAVLALAGLCAFLYGYFRDLPDARVSGSAILGAALARSVVWDDYASLGKLMCWLPPFIQALSSAAVYGLYRELRGAGRLSVEESQVSHAVFAGFAVLATVSITRYSPQFWASSSLAVLAAAMFFIGTALKEKFVRVTSCLVFTVVGLRAFISAETYAALGRARWLPIGLQLSSLLCVYLPYRRLIAAATEQESESAAPLGVFALLVFLTVFYLVTYGAGPVRPLLLTAGYIAFFVIGVLSGDIPLRASWLAIVPAAILTYLLLPAEPRSHLYKMVYAAAVCGGLYAVYAYYSGRLKDGASVLEKQALPALCLAAVLMALLSVDRCVPLIHKTTAASAVLVLLYLAGIALRDNVLALSAGVVVPYIFGRRFGAENYSALGGVGKWAAVLSAPGAFLAAHLAGVKYPGRVFGGVSRQLLAYICVLPGTLLLLHGLFYYASKSMITLSVGVAGLALFAPGFYFKDRPLRYAGLLMFAVAVVHIGAVDIAGLSIIYKIISFILLGLMLLGVSYVYTRFMVEDTADSGE